jgi:uncharacterized OB-fold protein
MAEARISRTKLEFPYSRTLGSVVGAFLTGLREQRLLGVRTKQGRVLVPPLEYDPDTAEAVDVEMVEVGPAATVESWTWVAEPTSKHPLDRPFAFALVRPDGADTALVHAVDAGGIDKMATGMRVTPRWRAEPAGLITDLECWVPAE